MDKLKTGTKLRFEFDATVNGYNDGWLDIVADGYVHRIYPRAVPNMTTRIKEPYEVGELYVDSDGDVFVYENDGKWPWRCVIAKYRATEVGESYIADYPNEPIVKLVPES